MKNYNHVNEIKNIVSIHKDKNKDPFGVFKIPNGYKILLTKEDNINLGLSLNYKNEQITILADCDSGVIENIFSTENGDIKNMNLNDNEISKILELFIYVYKYGEELASAI